MKEIGKNDRKEENENEIGLLQEKKEKIGQIKEIV